MKTLLQAIISSALLASCATKQAVTPAPAVAPTVRAPGKPAKPDLAPAATSTKAIEEANRQLAGRVTAATRENAKLSEWIDALESTQRITLQEAGDFRESAVKLSASLNEASEMIEDQAEEINKLHDQLMTAHGQIEVTDAMLAEQDAVIGRANETIELLTTNSQAIAAERAASEMEILKLKTEVVKIKGSRLRWRGSTAVLGLILASIIAWKVYVR